MREGEGKGCQGSPNCREARSAEACMVRLFECPAFVWVLGVAMGELRSIYWE